MFLTKKAFAKIIIMAICYFILGSSFLALAWLWHFFLEIDAGFLLIFGMALYAVDVLIVFWGYYAEGKGKLINLGNQLVRKELKPAAFIEKYLILKNSKDLVVNKPSVEVLQMVAIAYDALDERENCLAVVDEMISAAKKPQKKAYAKLMKTSFLFSYGKVEEAESILGEIQKLKLDLMCYASIDSILKSDRAKAMGDYKIVEAYNLKLLERKFPKLDNLGELVVRYNLGEIYEKMEDYEKAASYYQYCANFGGDTAIKPAAKAKLENLQSVFGVC